MTARTRGVDDRMRRETAGGHGQKKAPYRVSVRELEDRAASCIATAGVLMGEAVRLYAQAAAMREQERHSPPMASVTGRTVD